MESPPRSAIVVGAGVVGLSCAWHLQERGIEVVVLDRSGVGAGASRGNGGYLTPVLAVPLPEPTLVREGLRTLVSPDSPFTVAPRAPLRTAAFLTCFARNATPARWRAGLDALTPLGRASLPAFDELAHAGVVAAVHAAPIVVGFARERERRALHRELAEVGDAGQPVDISELDTPPAPFSSRIGSAIRLDGQRYVDPGGYVDGLAAAVRERGGSIVERERVQSIGSGPAGVQVDTGVGNPRRADAVVLATGAWLPELGRSLGVRVPMRAGRGYSFSVRLDTPITAPHYVPGARVALTPLGDRVRIAGIMEIHHPDAPLDTRKLHTVLNSARRFVDGIDLTDIRDSWVGPRPLTADGLPLVGRTTVPNVFVAGGHGMWGLTLGPVTGKLLAERIATARPVPELEPFDPLRSGWSRRAGSRTATSAGTL